MVDETLEPSVHEISSENDTSLYEDGNEAIPMASNNFCDVQSSNVIVPRTRSGANVASCAFLASFSEPTNYNEAVNCENSHEWKRAMQEEFDSLVKNGTWELVNLPESQRIVDNRWVYRIKRNQNDTIDRYKARLVARGFT